MIMVLVASATGYACTGSPQANTAYDPECRLRIYSQSMSHEEKQDWANEYAKRMTGGDHRIDKNDPSSEQVMENMGVPYYDECQMMGE